MSPEARAFFRSHDAVHVVYGCSVALDDEAIVKIASFLGTTAGFGVLRGYRLHESKEIYERLPLIDVLRTIALSVVLVPRTILRCRRQSERWPWSGFEPLLDVPLRELRDRFGIRVAHADD